MNYLDKALPMRYVQPLVAAVCITGMTYSNATLKNVSPLPFTTDVERCIVPASQFHGVNPFVLRAILKVESNLAPKAFGQNQNGTTDVGIGQMNSSHFPALAKFGINSSDLNDACVGTYVAAWQLKKGIARHGNTWEAIARYHSGTPYFNNRYQILINNELVRSNVLDGVIQKVPPLIKK